MHSSKSLAVMFLLGAVLVGGALGFTADRVWGRAGTCRDPGSSKECLYDRLELTTTQRAAWDSILDDRHRQFEVLFKPIRPQMDSIRSRARTQMRALLTPAQRERFEAILNASRSNEKRENSK